MYPPRGLKISSQVILTVRSFQQMSIITIYSYMGSKLSRHKKDKMQENQTQNQAPQLVLCSICNQQFQNQEIGQHAAECQLQLHLEQEIIISQILERERQEKLEWKTIRGLVDVKMPIDSTLTRFQWTKEKVDPRHSLTIKKEIDFVKRQDFISKFIWLRDQLDTLRQSHHKKARTFVIDKQNLIDSSIALMNKAEPNEEIKIQLMGEPTQDAGGLTREWLNLIIKELTVGKQAIFQLCPTSEPLLRIKYPQGSQNNIRLMDKFRLLGFVLARAIIENITLDCYLCWPLLRQLFRQDSTFELSDLFHYDEQFYKGLLFIKQTALQEDELELYFTVETQKGAEQLIPNGSSQKITEQNKGRYLLALLAHLFIKKESVFVQHIRSELFRFLSKDIFSAFELYEIEMVINGKAEIDLKDWKSHTVYKGQYHYDHQNIQWFWEVLETLTQQELSRLLKFVSGSSRLSVQGFQKLECNRGKTNQFQICDDEFNEHDPFPKGFTCFNRLILPRYPSKSIEQAFLKIIADSNLDGVFGLE